MKICIIVGTRPEIIKMAPLIKECQKRNIDFFILHSNQHYSESMDAIFFRDLELPQPRYNLNVGSSKHSNQTGNILIRIEPILETEKPDVVLVQGDTNTVLAGGLAASKMGIKVGHVEAGLRSYDRTMPEETNRIVTDHLSDYLFAVSDTQKTILEEEGVQRNKVFKVGNTIVDAVLQNKEIAKDKSQILETLGLKAGDYTLFTAHRAGNVDRKESLIEILNIIEDIPGPVCWPVHLRTKSFLEKFELELPQNVVACEPLGYFDFLNLERFAKLIVTDSGGLQEEACILGVPCITIRENTERPETVDVGANFLIGRDRTLLKKGLENLGSSWTNPFGKGNTASLILDIIGEDFGIKPHKPERSEKVSVIGLGYMGLPTAALLANSGFTVTGVDLDDHKVEKVNQGECYFDEVGIPELIADAVRLEKLSASTSFSHSDVYIVAVPTPHKDRKCDLTYVLNVCHEIAKVAQDNDLVIIESTIKPKTCENYVMPIFEEKGINIHLCHCPERAIPGNSLYELVHNDRVVGGLTPEASSLAYDLYSSFVKGDILMTTAVNAECAKLMENTFRDVNIALANEFDNLAQDLGFDVRTSIRLANRHPRVNILQPGPGVGGHCIPVDPWFLSEDSDKAKLITLAREINDLRPIELARSVKEKLQETGGRNVAVLGVAYKKNVDDDRETPAKSLIDELQRLEMNVRAHDPLIQGGEFDLYTREELQGWADVYVLVTDHDVFKTYKFDKPLIDTRNMF